MSRVDAVRLAGVLAQCEIALVQRDPVAGPLLAQAARAAAGLPAEPLVAAAARLVRLAAPADRAPAAAASRKVVQALCRAAAQSAQADLLAERGPR